MKLRLLLFLFASTSLISVKSQSPQNVTVQCSATVSKAPAVISISWKKDQTATAYKVYRKLKDQTSWGTVIKNLAGTDSVYRDSSVAVGELYEYRIQKTIPQGNVAGYIHAGIEAAAVEFRGRLLLVIDTSVLSPGLPELEKTRRDLVGDGWKFNEIWVSKTDSVHRIKAQIVYYVNMLKDVKAVYLLGHVPVPYSGDFFNGPYPAPDGHNDHGGAWPSDGYYGDTEGYWSDEATNTAPSRAQNKNLPADGKFDQIIYETDIELQVGRVDLANMPAFGKTEQQLLVQYLKKSSDFKNKQYVPANRAIIDDNFGYFSGEAFSSTAFGSFSSMVGYNNIQTGKMLQVMDTASYLFAYGCGGGSYTSVGGIGTTDSFVNNQVTAPFFSLFGSYFGDWDATNNVLRAPLAAMPSGLASVWSGRPYWHFHHMSLGENIGYSAKLTMNNTTHYMSANFAHVVHIGLMGDPTLRLHYVAPPTNVNASGTAGNTKVDVSWNASSDPAVIGYNVYRSHGLRGSFEKLNSTPVTSTSITDNSPYQGNNIYMVRAVKVQETASGTYFNMSIGQFAELGGISGKANHITENQELSMLVYPNPSSGTVTISFQNSSEPVALRIFDGTGRVIFEKFGIFDSTNLDGSQLPRGLYFVQLVRGGNTSNAKILFN